VADQRHRLREIERLRTDRLISEHDYQAEARALLEDAVRSNQRRSSRGCGWLAFIGVGIIASLVALYVVFVIAYKHELSTTATTASSTDTHASLAPGSSASVPAIGGTANLTITNVDDPALEADVIASQPGFHHVAVSVRIDSAVENAGGGDFISSFFAHTSDGAALPPTSMSTVLIFDVADGTSIDWLKFKSNLLLSGVSFDAVTTPAAQ
jgi:hypothetical protein